MSCPVCESPDAELFLTRRSVPVHQNALCADEETARRIGRGDLEMTVCRRCAFVFNRAFDASKLHYDEEYENTQVCSPAFNAYVDGLVAHLLDECGLRGKTIVEVGCGKGYFLEKLVRRDPTLRGIGFDPACSDPLSRHDGRLQFHRRFYGGQQETVHADAVICRHVIEHVADPAALVRSIRETGATRVFFETPCVEWILRHQVMWDFFYEHCSLFTVGSITTLFERCGFEVTAARHLFDGQYLWIEARPAGERLVRSGADEIVLLARDYAAAERQAVYRLRQHVDELRARGNVAIWGAGAKGVTFVNLIDDDRQRIACVADLNPRKQGHFIPATAHPIVDYHQLPAWDVRSAIVMNPNYLDENRQLVAAAGLDVDLYVEQT